ncbi:MAG: sigma 54-interacting transcriptional regulator [Candidatus Acidiferrales bacterium]
MSSPVTGTVIALETWNYVDGMSPAMQTVETVARELAATSIPILLVGESGTGKEVLAQRIHRLSKRAGELRKLECAAASVTTISAELGISPNRNGEVRAVEAGTILLNEVSELDAGCQRILLYALPDGEAAGRRGMLASRVISTTTRNLDEEMRAGRFRSELYYRINGVCLRLPPLRERKEDIPLLVEFFLTKHAAEFGKTRPTLTPRSLRMFLDYAWPGNIRELEHAVKKIVALGDEQLALTELTTSRVEPISAAPADARANSLKAAARAASREAERGMILDTLARTRWNRKRAAQELQISYKSLLYKLKQIGVPDTEANS